MKKLIFSAVMAVMLCAACSESVDEVATIEFDTFSATMNTTRTTLGDDNSVLWNEGDLVSIFNKTTDNLMYEAVNVNATTATLQRKSGMRGAKTLEYNYAIFPYDSKATLTAAGVISSSIASEQTYTVDTNLQHAPMVAKSTDTSLSFTNPAALIRCNVNTVIGGTTLSNIKVVSASQNIAGKVAIDMSTEAPIAVVTEGVKEITLDCGDAEIGEEYTSFYIVLAETTFPANDLKIVYTATFDGEEHVIEYPVKSEITFVAGTVKTTSLTIEETFEGTTTPVNTYAQKVAEALAAGEDVTLVEDIEVSEALAITGDATLDLNGKNITTTKSLYIKDEISAVICVKDGATLTLKGDGTIDGAAYDDYAVEVRNGGNLIIEGGEYIGSVTAVYALGGNITIKGGDFKVNDTQYGTTYLLNLRDNTNSSISVEGGNFYGFNPADNKAENPAVNFVAEGYISVETETGVWSVVPATTTVEVASAAALADVLEQGGKNVTLSEDIEVSEALAITGDATLDLNGKNITTTKSLYIKDEISAVICVKDGATLTLKGDGTIDGVAYDDYAVEVRNGGNLIIEGGEYIGSVTAVYAFDGNITIKGGDFKVNDTTYGTTYLLNLRGNTNSSISVEGGNFYGFNPADNKAENPAVNFVAEGYVSVENTTGVWTVVPQN